jgi:hypothetical protein
MSDDKFSIASQISDGIRQNSEDINRMNYGQVVFYIQDHKAVRCEIVFSRMMNNQEKRQKEDKDGK